MKAEPRRSLCKRITTNIKTILDHKDLKQEHIHRHSDLDKGNLSRYFSGNRAYTLLSLQRIADALEVDISLLLHPDGHPLNDNSAPVFTSTLATTPIKALIPGPPGRNAKSKSAE